MTRHGDEVRAGLDHARGNGADAGVGDQLHRHQGRRIHRAQVVDQLGQILDGIDVVVRRRRDQADARLGVAQARDQRIDLVAGQLAALAGLGALGDLDLQHLGVDQVGGRDAEAAGGHLLDLGRALGAVACGVLAALAGIAARAKAVHAGGQGFVRLGDSAPSDMPAESKRFSTAASGSTASSASGAAAGTTCRRSRRVEGARLFTASA